MNPYVAVFLARVKLILQYRAATVAGLLTGVFWGILKVMIFTAFYTHSTAYDLPMTLAEVIAYSWMSQALISLMPWQLPRDIADMVRSGSVVYELTKPIQLYGMWFSHSLAIRFAPSILKALPILLLAGLFWGLPPPPTLASGMAFSVALVGAFLLSAALTTLTTISLFWTVTGEGLARLMPSLTLSLSGLLVPLPLFPDGLQAFLNFLPFRGIIDTPFRLYLGNIPPEQALGPLLHQAIWILIIVALGCGVLQRAQRRLEVHGG